MRKIEWILFREHHLCEIGMDDKTYNAVKGLISPPAFTAMCEGQLICCAGIALMWEGVGEAWFVPGENAKAYVGLPGAVKRLLDELQDEYGLWRVQATVDVNNPKAYQMDTWLGFEDEGIMRKYNTEGHDCYRLARVT